MPELLRTSMLLLRGFFLSEVPPANAGISSGETIGDELIVQAAGLVSNNYKMNISTVRNTQITEKHRSELLWHSES